MGGYWVQFAATGDPNREGLPRWPAYDSETDQYLEFGDEIVVGSGLSREACALYEEIQKARRLTE